MEPRTDARSAHPVDVTTRIVRAPRALVWEMWTSPEHLRRWLLGPPGWTMTACEVDLRPGGRYRFVWRAPDGSRSELVGRYHEVVAPERLVATEWWDGGSVGALASVDLGEADGRTTITSRRIWLSGRDPGAAAVVAPRRAGRARRMTAPLGAAAAWLAVHTTNAERAAACAR